MKLCVFFLLCILAFNLNAQVDRTNFRGGVHGGMVVGDLSEGYSLTLGVDLYQHWGVSREIDLGIATGFTNAFGETNNDILQDGFPNIQFVPLAGSFRVYPTSGFKFGGDIGYALGVNKGNEGGFYYRPSVGFDMSGGSTELNFSYFAVNGDVTFSSILVGLLFLF